MTIKKEATTRSQFLDYNLIRSGRFNRSEQALLTYIVSFSENCRMPQIEIAKALCCSISTIRRTINSLINKGIIQRTYGVFKKTILKIISLKEQAKLNSLSGMIKQAFLIGKKRAKKLMKSSDRSPMNELNRSPMNESTRSKTEEIKPENQVKNLSNSFNAKPFFNSIFEKATFEIERMRNHERSLLKNN